MFQFVGREKSPTFLSSLLGFGFGKNEAHWPEGCPGSHRVLVSHAAMDLAQAGRTVESKIYDTLQWQVGDQLGGCGLDGPGA